MKTIELKIFIELAKLVRLEQERRMAVREERGYNPVNITQNSDPSNTSKHLFLQWRGVIFNIAKTVEAPEKQVKAILYNLKEQGYVKIHQHGGKYKYKFTGITPKGFNFINQIKKGAS